MLIALPTIAALFKASERYGSKGFPFTASREPWTTPQSQNLAFSYSEFPSLIDRMAKIVFCLAFVYVEAVISRRSEHEAQNGRLSFQSGWATTDFWEPSAANAISKTVC